MRVAGTRCIQYDGRHEFSHSGCTRSPGNLTIDHLRRKAASSQLETHSWQAEDSALPTRFHRWAICPGYGGAARGGRTRHGGNERPAHRVPRDRSPSLLGGAWARGDRDLLPKAPWHGESRLYRALNMLMGSPDKERGMTQSSHQGARGD